MKDKTTAGLLALFLGGFGVHQFYLGESKIGIAHAVPVMVFKSTFVIFMSYVFAWITAISLFSMDQDEFDRKYNQGKIKKEPYDYREADFERRQEEKREKRRARQKRREYQQAPRKQAKNYDFSRSKPPKKRNKPNPFKTSGIAKFKEYDYEGAISDFIKSLEIAPDDIATHFNLACSYSLTETPDKAFYHLDKAVA